MSLLKGYARLPHSLRRLFYVMGRCIAPAKIAKALKGGSIEPQDGYALIKSIFPPNGLYALLSEDLNAQIWGISSAVEFDAALRA